MSKAITNCGAEETPGDGGNATLHYCYDNQWRILEARNGSNQSTRQWVWGTGGTGVSAQNVAGGYCIGVTTAIASSDCIPRRRWAVPTLRNSLADGADDHAYLFDAAGVRDNPVMMLQIRISTFSRRR